MPIRELYPRYSPSYTSDNLVLVLGGAVPLALFRNIPAELTGLQADIQVPPACYVCIAAVYSVFDRGLRLVCLWLGFVILCYARVVDTSESSEHDTTFHPRFLLNK